MKEQQLELYPRSIVQHRPTSMPEEQITSTCVCKGVSKTIVWNKDNDTNNLFQQKQDDCVHLLPESLRNQLLFQV